MCLITWHFSLYAQTITTIASGLITPSGISRDTENNLWVAETGTGANDGRVSMITPDETVYLVAENLYSYLDPTTFETTGAWRAIHKDDKLYVLIGKGTGADAGVVLVFDLTGFTPGGTPFSAADALETIAVSEYAYSNGFIDSNPYSLAWDASGNLYISDAGANAVFKYDVISETLSTLTTFTAIPNEFTPFPPFIDYVPTRIIEKPGGGFYVCNLTGFPFLPGLATIKVVDESGTATDFYTGLSLLTDLDVDAATGDVYALQFGIFDTSFTPIFNSAKILKITAAGDTSTFIAGFGPSAGMVLDGSGGVYMTNIFTGEVQHYIVPVNIDDAQTVSSFEINPNPVSEGFTFHAHAEISEIKIFTMSGACVYEKAIINDEQINISNLASGIYFLTAYSATGNETMKIIKQ